MPIYSSLAGESVLLLGEAGLSVMKSGAQIFGGEFRILTIGCRARQTKSQFV